MRVLVLMPTQREGALTGDLLAQAGIRAELCVALSDFCQKMRAGAGAAIVAEEMLQPDSLDLLEGELRQAPTWSDLPLLVLTGVDAHAASWEWVQRLEGTANVTLLERPLRSRTAISVVQSALRARQLQYQARDQLWECQQAQEASRESEEKFRVLAENARASFGIVQGERFLYANPYFAEVSGYTIPELLSMTFPQLVHPDFRPLMIERARRRQMGEPIPNHYEFAMITKAGQKRWVDFSVAAIEYKGKSAIIGTGFDITERKFAEEALRRSEEQRRLAMKAAHMGSWEIDLIRDEATLDEPCRAIWAAPDWSTVSMMDIYARIHPDDRVEVAERIASRSKGEGDGMGEMEFRIIWPDGQVRWLRAAGHAILGDHGGQVRAVRGVGVTVDITDQKRAEHQLKNLNEQLEQLVTQRTAVAERRAEQLRSLAMDLTQAEQRERERLARVLHDHLQQLLVGIKFNVSMLRGKVTEADSLAKVGQLDSLVDESITTSRSLVVDLSPPILRQGTMSQVLAWLSDWVLEKHGLVVSVRADEGADPVRGEIRALLFQAVRELLLNVVKHARVKQASVDLRRVSGEQVQVVVSDGGVGFDPADRLSGQQGSGGFGLFSIRERLEALGGSMDVSSASDRGTRITLTAPVRTSPLQEP